jgi:hypothetical protein
MSVNKNNMKKILGFLGLTALTLSFQAMASSSSGPFDSKLYKGDLGKLGTYRVRVDRVEEPSSLPLRVSIDVSCEAHSISRLVMDEEMACEFEGVTELKKELLVSYRVQNAKGTSCSEKKSFKKSFVELCSKE